MATHPERENRLEEMKKEMKRLADEAEVKLARAFLRWKHKKEGDLPPEEKQLERDSRRIARKTHEVISRRGKNIWREFRSVYTKNDGREKGSEE